MSSAASAGRAGSTASQVPPATRSTPPTSRPGVPSRAGETSSTAAGLADHLELHRIERAQMPVIDRLANHYRRYLIEADV